MQTTVSLSERAFINVSDIARLTERTIDEVIEETFETRFDEQVELLKKSVEFSSDAEILKLVDFRMPEIESERLSNLLNKNSEGVLPDTEREELGSLMQTNRFNDLRKAIGIAEALKRGLIRSVEEVM